MHVLGLLGNRLNKKAGNPTELPGPAVVNASQEIRKQAESTAKMIHVMLGAQLLRGTVDHQTLPLDKDWDLHIDIDQDESVGDHPNWDTVPVYAWIFGSRNYPEFEEPESIYRVTPNIVEEIHDNPGPLTLEQMQGLYVDLRGAIDAASQKR